MPKLLPVYAVPHRSFYTQTALAAVSACARQAGEGVTFPLDLSRPPSELYMKSRFDQNGSGIWLFSDYVWCQKENLANGRKVKEWDPAGLVIHGGPQAPQYPHAAQPFFDANPHIDIIVRGEGELTMRALAEALPADGDRWQALAGIEGITY